MKNMKRSLAFLFVFVLMLAAFTACQQPQEEHTHVFADATCTAPKTCECGATEGEALGHTFVEGKCACGAEDPNYEVHEHNYESVVTAPTCTEKGFTTYTCACGDTYTGDEVAASGHSHVAVVTAPTCTEKGFTTYTCACGDTYTGNEVAAKHSFDANGVCSACKGEATIVMPEVNKPYIFGMYQGNKKAVYYLKGGMSGYYMAASTNPAEAIYVYLENAEGGYHLYCYVNGAKTYINMVVSGTHVNGAYEATATTVYTIDAESKTVIAKVNGTDYWFATRNDNTYTTVGPCAVSYKGFFCEFYDAHIHNYVKGETFAPTCTEQGYTAYNCNCGAEKKEDLTPSNGHTPGEWEIETNATCTEDGKKVIKCTVDGCGALISSEVIPAAGHTYIDGKCSCGAEDPNYSAHEHNYDAVVTAPTCTAAGYTTFTCACGDTYTGDETEKLGHIDENLDVECDRTGCTNKVAPPANATLSTYTANCLGSKVSTSNSYYVVGTIVEVLDAKNGIFLVDDGTGETFYFRLPVNADGVSHANWQIKFVLGDKVQVYGKINKFSSSSAPNGQYWPAMQAPVATLLEQHAHDFTTIPATCSEPAFCACGQSHGEPLGCADADSDNLCDDCGRNVNYIYEYVEIRTDNNSGVLDATAGTYTWSNNNFDVQVAKGTSTQLYSTAKDHMRLYKGNQLVLANKNGITVKTITVYLTNATQVTNFQKFITGYTYTTDAENFTVTVEINSAETLTLTNTGSTTQIKGVEFGYEKPNA